MQKHVQEKEAKHIFSDEDIKQFADLFSILIRIDQASKKSAIKDINNEIRISHSESSLQK